jgi:hypothetical protein
MDTRLCTGTRDKHDGATRLRACVQTAFGCIRLLPVCRNMGSWSEAGLPSVKVRIARDTSKVARGCTCHEVAMVGTAPWLMAPTNDWASAASMGPVRVTPSICLGRVRSKMRLVSWSRPAWNSGRSAAGASASRRCSCCSSWTGRTRVKQSRRGKRARMDSRIWESGNRSGLAAIKQDSRWWTHSETIFDICEEVDCGRCSKAWRLQDHLKPKMHTLIFIRFEVLL